MGVIEFNLTNYPAAIKYYTKAIDLGMVEQHIAYFNRGHTKYFQSRYEEAIKDFDEAIRLNVRYSDAYKFRGECYYSLNQREKASDDFKEYLKLEREKLDEETIKHYEGIIIPDDPNILERLERVCEQLGIGKLNDLLKTLLIVMGLEYAIIIGCGIREGNLTVGVVASKFGIKIILLIFIMVANALEKLEALSGWEIRNAVIAVILVRELLSVIKNSLGMPVPDWLKDLSNYIDAKIEDILRKIFGPRQQQ